MKAINNLAYFDVFDHPLKEDELLNSTTPNSTIKQDFNNLIDNNLVYSKSSFFSISSNIESLINKRIEKEERAKQYFKKLPFYATILKSFPFVKGIAISGSLSKGVMHEDGDIDYFIITSKNRLWICRTLLILFKKIFLLNSRKYFCLNYFVDESNLEIKDKNIFTAVEVTHLVPVYNFKLINVLKTKNNWTKNYLLGSTNTIKVDEILGGSIMKSILESVIRGHFAEKLDLFFMKVTAKRWSSKFKNFDENKLELTMRSNRGVSKHHPSDFQTKVLAAYQERLEKVTLNNEGFINT